MSDSVRPHRQQPTRLPRPWDSPGKNTGVGCHFLLQCMNVKSESEAAQSCPTPQPSRLLRPWDFPGKSTGVGAIAFSDLFHRGIQLTGNQVIPRASQVALVVKNPSANAGDVGSIPGLGGSPGEGYGNQFQYSAWRIAWTGEPGGLQSMGLQRVGHD